MAKRTTSGAARRQDEARVSSNSKPRPATRGSDADAALRGLPLSEYVGRRERVLKGLKGAGGIVFAGEGAAPLKGRWEPNLDFVYLTGIANEPGAAVGFFPTAPDPARRIVLFLRPQNPEMERWDGMRPEISEDLRERYGFSTIWRTHAVAPALTSEASRGKRLACLHPFSVYDAPVSPDLAAFQKIAARVPGVAIEDASKLLSRLRAIKSGPELKIMERAASATLRGYERALAVLSRAPDSPVTERDVHEALVDGYVEGGADSWGGTAYNPIVGAGLNATVLHYNDNDQPIAPDDLVLIDSGAQVDGYACDVTRCYPASGRFGDEQREIYELVLKAQEASIRAAKPGATMHEVDKAGRDIIRRAGYGSTYIHGVGHDLGLDVHDPDPHEPLKPGRVIMIEPGVYLPDRRIGVRIEDDILITANGNRNLTNAFAKSVADVEAAMARAKAGGPR